MIKIASAIINLQCNQSCVTAQLTKPTGVKKRVVNVVTSVFKNGNWEF
jgi:hypothetical protein